MTVIREFIQPAALPEAAHRGVARPAVRGASRTLRVGAAILGAAALALVPAAAASAHVHVIPDSTAADGFAKLVFRVPNESDSAGTTKVEVTLPTAAPFRSVSVQPVAGWTAQIVEGALPAPVAIDGATLTEAPLSVVWTAAGDTQIAPGQFQEFAISAGPLPAAGTELVLPTTQTYSDGEVVAWDQPAEEGAPEPESPAPSLVTTAAESDEHAHVAAAATVSAPAAVSTSGAGAGSDPLARWLGGIGLLVGALGLAVAAASARAVRIRP